MYNEDENIYKDKGKYSTLYRSLEVWNKNLYKFIQKLLINRAGSLNQGAATASTKPILKAAHLIAIFKRKMAVVSWKHLENCHQLVGSSHLALPVSL